MSRSIHMTRRKYVQVGGGAAAAAELRRKRRIKRQVDAERGREPPVGVPIPVAELPIVVTDQGPYVFHALTAQDIRTVLERLPGAAVEGITEIRLELGVAEMEGVHARFEGEPDPYTGRFGSLYFPGVYTGPLLGTYAPYSGRVTVFAHVMDPAALTMPRPVAEFFLKLQAFRTLLHEVAHFHDYAARLGRGRWLCDRTANKERYAETMEERWTNEEAVPYLEKHYARECRAFRAWVRPRGGRGGLLALDPFRQAGFATTGRLGQSGG